MDGDKPIQPANRNCYRLSCVSGALAQISCCNPKIPGLGIRQSQDSGLAKTARMWDPSIAIATHSNCDSKQRHVIGQFLFSVEITFFFHKFFGIIDISKLLSYSTIVSI